MSLKMKMEGNLKEAGAYKEYELWRRIEITKWVVTGIVAVSGFFVCWPIEMLIAGYPEKAMAFYPVLLQVVTGDVGLFEFVFTTYGGIIKKSFLETGLLPWSIFGWIAAVMVSYSAFSAINRYRRTPNIFGDARWSNETDIEEMAARDLVGFEDSKKNPKKLFVLGKFKDRLLRMGETLSILLLAPPGTGKSVGFIVPSIVELDHCSIFVHDQKPELWDMTSGHRRKLGPCFLLKWAAQDLPDGKWVSEAEAALMDPSMLEEENGKPKRDPDTGLIKTKPIFYPSWNPLSPKCLPPLGTSRDMYLDRLSQTLCPDGSMNDKFWSSKARAALTGLTHYLCAKVEAALDPEIQGSWDGIPEQWHGREASYPMLVDWLAYAQSGIDGSEDPMRDILKAAIDEAKELDLKFQKHRGLRPMNRAIVEMTGLMTTPDKTRGSIITTLDDAMAPFKMESVRQRTSSTDIAFYELRGIPKPEAVEREKKREAEAKAAGRPYRPSYKPDEWQPVSVYISVDLENAKAFATITSVFIDAANAYLVANGPNSVDEMGHQTGPYPFGFLIDEAPQLGKLDTVINGPAVGRSKKVFYVIVGQDFGQFEQKYSKPEVETLKSTTAIKIVLTQNNESTAKQISEMAGKMTFQKQSFSDAPRKGIEGFLFGGGKSASESWEQVEFLKPSFLMSLPRDKHVVLVQNFMNRPILCDTPKFFLENKGNRKRPPIASKVFNLRTLTGPRPAAPMDAESTANAAKRHAEFERRRHAIEETAPESGASGLTGDPLASPGAGLDAAPTVIDGTLDDDDPRRVIIVTPADMLAMTRDEEGRKSWRDDTQFVLFETKIEPGEENLEEPTPDAITLTTDPAEVARIVGTSKYFVFSEELLEEQINGPLRQSGAKGLPRARALFVNEIAASLGEQSLDDIYFLGFQGGPALTYPYDPAAITSDFVMSWMCQVIDFLISTDIRRQIYDDIDLFIEDLEDDPEDDEGDDVASDGAASVDAG